MDRARGGLGSGLSLVRRLWSFTAEPWGAQSRGSAKAALVVRLPLAAGAGSTNPNPNPNPNPSAEAVVKAPRLKILVVDDNTDVADGLAALLEFDGHEIRTAHDGGTALKEAAEFTPDVVFCDIGMPEMTGHELAARLRLDPAQVDAGWP